MDLMPDYIPLFVILKTETSSIIECETSEQRTVRLMREDKINHIKSKIEKIKMRIIQERN